MEIFEVPFYDNSLKVVATDQGVTEIQWQKRKPKKSQTKTPVEKKFTQTLKKYVDGSGDAEFQIDWENLSGTDFQKSVWKKMTKIPYGKTKSYGQIAKQLRKPGAARAVGTACGANPVLLAIPCHRVVGSNGLGGFSGGGLPVKRLLLDLEEVESAN